MAVVVGASLLAKARDNTVVDEIDNVPRRDARVVPEAAIAWDEAGELAKRLAQGADEDAMNESQ